MHQRRLRAWNFQKASEALARASNSLDLKKQKIAAQSLTKLSMAARVGVEDAAFESGRDNAFLIVRSLSRGKSTEEGLFVDGTAQAPPRAQVLSDSPVNPSPKAVIGPPRNMKPKPALRVRRGEGLGSSQEGIADKAKRSLPVNDQVSSTKHATVEGMVAAFELGCEDGFDMVRRGSDEGISILSLLRPSSSSVTLESAVEHAPFVSMHLLSRIRARVEKVQVQLRKKAPHSARGAFAPIVEIARVTTRAAAGLVALRDRDGRLNMRASTPAQDTALTREELEKWAAIQIQRMARAVALRTRFDGIAVATRTTKLKAEAKLFDESQVSPPEADRSATRIWLAQDAAAETRKRLIQRGLCETSALGARDGSELVGMRARSVHGPLDLSRTPRSPFWLVPNEVVPPKRGVLLKPTHSSSLSSVSVMLSGGLGSYYHS